MKLSKARDIEAGTALALAIIGDTVQSQKLVNDMAKRFPEDTVVQFNHLPSITVGRSRWNRLERRGRRWSNTP